MPNLSSNGVELYYEQHGEGPETIVFGHGLLLHGRMFQPQIDALAARYRCIAFDFRSHGRSELTRDGLDVDSLTRDAAAVIEALGAAPCHYVGLSMGGFVGLRLAIRRPELLRSLSLLDTSAEPEPHLWRFLLMSAAARWLSPRLVIDRVLRNIFGPTFRRDPSRAAELEHWRGQILQNNLPIMNRATVAVLRRTSVFDQLDRIETPTLILVGEDDGVTPPVHSRRLHAAIAGSQLVTIPHAGHITPIESPEAVTAALQTFLAQHAVAGTRHGV